MLRQPGSPYEAGRSSTLLKVKTFHDAEAIVIGHEPGAGRHKGRLGALSVRLPSGIMFSVGTGFSDKERGNPPAVGSAITFRYQELSDAGVPRFPSYVGVRCDEPLVSEPVAAKRAPSKAAAINTAPATAISVPATAGSGSKPRHFEYVGGSSRKFWSISWTGRELTTRWGRIGSEGQSKTKSLADEAAAAKAVERLIAEKTAEGYAEK